MTFFTTLTTVQKDKARSSHFPGTHQLANEMVIAAVHCRLGLDLTPQCRISNCNTWLTYLSQEHWCSNPQVFKLRGVEKHLCVKLHNTDRSRAVLFLSSSVRPHSVLKGTESLNRSNWRKVLSATVTVPLLLFLSFDCSLPLIVRAWFCSNRESREVLPVLYRYRVWHPTTRRALPHLQTDQFRLTARTPLD